jgi:hypothetical protein
MIFFFLSFFRQAVELATKDNREFEDLCVYVAQDCAGTSYLIEVRPNNKVLGLMLLHHCSVVHRPLVAGF